MKQYTVHAETKRTDHKTLASAMRDYDEAGGLCSIIPHTDAARDALLNALRARGNGPLCDGLLHDSKGAPEHERALRLMMRHGNALARAAARERAQFSRHYRMTHGAPTDALPTLTAEERRAADREIDAVYAAE